LKNVTESLQEYSNDQKHHMLQEVQARVMAAKHSKTQVTYFKQIFLLFYITTFIELALAS